jgi:hypothetical protein
MQQPSKKSYDENIFYGKGCKHYLNDKIKLTIDAINDFEKIKINKEIL